MSVPIPYEVQEIMAEMSAITFAARNPKTGKPIEIKTKGHSYLYYRTKNGNDYCYTPHPDNDGWYYSFAYVGFGPGSRVGKAKKFKMKFLACHRQRKAAKARALRMRSAAEHPLHPTGGTVSDSSHEEQAPSG